MINQHTLKDVITRLALIGALLGSRQRSNSRHPRDWDALERAELTAVLDQFDPVFPKLLALNEQAPRVSGAVFDHAALIHDLAQIERRIVTYVRGDEDALKPHRPGVDASGPRPIRRRARH